MTSHRPEFLKSLLDAKRHELVHRLKEREEIHIERVAEDLDAVQHAASRELAVAALDHRSGLLREVEAALGRWKTGTYGTCLGCGGAIALGRLRALPWASFCIHCQEAADAERGGRPGTFARAA